MRSCSMALGLLSSALGSYMAGMLTWLVQVYSEKLTGQQWLPNDLNLVSKGTAVGSGGGGAKSKQSTCGQPACEAAGR